jgi:hypothetical protein
MAWGFLLLARTASQAPACISQGAAPFAGCEASCTLSCRTCSRCQGVPWFTVKTQEIEKGKVQVTPDGPLCRECGTLVEAFPNIGTNEEAIRGLSQGGLVFVTDGQGTVLLPATVRIPV